MSGMLREGPFVAVFPDLVRALGSMEAAAVLQFVAYSEEREEGVVLAAQVIADGTGLTVRTVKRLTLRLREEGLLTGERASAWDATLRFTVNHEHPILAGQPESAKVAPSRGPDGTLGSAKVAPCQSAKVAPSPSDLEVGEELHADTSAEDPADGALFEAPAAAAAPEPTGPPKTAQTLVARWCDGYRSANAGDDAPAPFLKRVAGQARSLAKACGDDHDAWVAAYHAAHLAGVAGHADMTRHLVKTRPTGLRRGNHLLELGGRGAEALANMGVAGYGAPSSPFDPPAQIGPAR